MAPKTCGFLHGESCPSSTQKGSQTRACKRLVISAIIK